MRSAVILAMLFLAALGARAQPQAATAPIVVEPVKQISVRDLWRSASPILAHSSSGGVISFWPTDPEQAERKDGRILLGIAAAGLGDLGETPVGAKIWGLPKVSMLQGATRAFDKTSTDAAIFFGKQEPDCQKTKPPACLSNLFRWSVGLDGTVRADGQIVGQVTGPR